jgi:acyl-CoA synthetase (AMP-forming)/AMP-acid ligase II
VTLLSILASNAIALPLSPAFPASELKYIMDNSQAKMLVATEKYKNKAEEVLKTGLEREPIFDLRAKTKTGASTTESVEFQNLLDADLKGGMMLYTSGTTNRPVRSPEDEFLCNDFLFEF